MAGKSTPPPANLSSSKTNYPKAQRLPPGWDGQNDHPRRIPGNEPHAQQQTHDPQQLAEQSRVSRADISQWREDSKLPDKGPKG